MGKTWVLHTETKGTGAQVVPLESVTKRSSVQAPVFVPREPAPREPEAVKPRPPRRFRVVDVMTRQALADDVGAREAVEALRDVRSIVDVNVFVWEEGAPALADAHVRRASRAVGARGAPPGICRVFDVTSVHVLDLESDLVEFPRSRAWDPQPPGPRAYRRVRAGTRSAAAHPSRRSRCGHRRAR